jgi:hypothetical protein
MSRKKFNGVQEAHIRIPLALLNSPAFVALSASGKALFVDLRSRLRSTNNGNLSCPLSELKHRGWRSSATLSKSLRELESVGFIRKTRSTVGVQNGSKVCSLFRFTDIESYEHVKQGTAYFKASNEWAAFESVRAAQNAIDSGLDKKRTIQNLNRDASKIEPIGSFDASEFEATPPVKRSKIEPSDIHSQSP